MQTFMGGSMKRSVKRAKQNHWISKFKIAAFATASIITLSQTMASADTNTEAKEDSRHIAIVSWMAPIAGTYEFQGNHPLCQSFKIEGDEIFVDLLGQSGWSLSTVWKPNIISVQPTQLIYETPDNWGEIFMDPKDLGDQCKKFDIKEKLELTKDSSGKLTSLKVMDFFKDYETGNCIDYETRQMTAYTWETLRTIECSSK